jgi:5-formyltetrahydrofolate cyclo-ligase
MSIATRKQQARDRAKVTRAGLSANPNDFVRHWPGMETSAIIAGYWPIKDEVDVRPLLSHLAKTHTILLPVTPRDRLRLSFRRWTPGCAMEAGPFGTQHPVGQPGDGRAAFAPDVIMVPMLAFTKQGDRLGYGGGFYDATLAALLSGNPALRTVGVAYAGQSVKLLPMEPTDVPLDHILTENGLITTHI